MVITIDGPAGAGKSTVAKILSQRLGFLYVDTGAMYRALTLKAINEKVKIEDIDALVRLARRTKILLKADAQGNLKILLDGNDVSEKIRTPQLTQAVFKIARIPQIRQIMVKWQRQYSEMNNIVMEGRDIGTVVFPQAKKKFYLDADFKVRAQRRVKDLEKKFGRVDVRNVARQIKDRDLKDVRRSCGPLKKADDAIYIDSTDLNIEQVVDIALEYLKDET